MYWKYLGTGKTSLAIEIKRIFDENNIKIKP